MTATVGYATLQLIPSMKGAESALAKEAETAGGSFAKTFAKGVAAAAVAGVAAAAAFGSKAAATFAEVGGEVSKLTRYTGGSAEEMSRLRFAAHETGIDTDALGASLGILSKHLGANDKAARAMGVTYRDTHGKALPLNTVLLGLAERFKKMPDGIDKNKLALDLFGRSGLQLLPFLNKGKDGLAALEAEATKFGVVLTQDNLDAVRKNTVAHREFDAAMEGLQIQVGQYVLPAFTALATLATNTLLPAITSVGKFAKEYLGPAFEAGFSLAERVMASVVAFATNRLLPGVKAAIDKTILAVEPFGVKAREYFDRARAAVEDRLVPALRGKLLPALQEIAGFVGDHLGPALAGIGAGGLVALAPQIASLGGSIGGMIQGIAVLPLGLSAVVIGVAALVAGLVYAYQHSEKFRAIVDKVAAVLKEKLAVAVAWVRDMWPGFQAAVERFVVFLQTSVLPVVKLVAGYIVEQFSNAVAWFREIWPQVSEAVSHVLNVVSNIVGSFVSMMQAAWEMWGADILAVVQTAWGFIKTTIENVLTLIRGVIEAGLAIINGDWGKAWDALKEILGAVWDEIKAAVRLGVDGLGEVLSIAWDGLKNAVHAAWDRVTEIVSDAWSAISDLVVQGVNDLIDIINYPLDVIGQGIDHIRAKAAAPIKFGTVEFSGPFALPGFQAPATAPHVSTHARGGYLNRGWNLLGDGGGPELVNRETGLVLNAAQTERATASTSGAPGKSVHIDTMVVQTTEPPRRFLNEGIWRMAG